MQLTEKINCTVMHTRTSTRSKRDLFYFIFADFYVIFECEENLPFKIAPSDLYSRTIKSKLLKQKNFFSIFFLFFLFTVFILLTSLFISASAAAAVSL